MKRNWFRLLALAIPFVGLYLASCNIGPEQTQQAFAMQHPEDLVGFDSLAIFLEDKDGNPLDTLYRKKPASEEEFKNLIAPNFEGGEVVIHLKGFKGGKLTLDNQIVYNTESKSIVRTILTRSPDTKVALAESVIAVTVGDTFFLPAAQVTPTGLSQTGVSWSSSSPAQISATNGPKWVALAPGEATMRASWQGDASIYANLLIQIFDANPNETGSVGTSLNLLPDSLVLNAGSPPVNVPRMVGPTGANQAISWTIADPAIAGSVGSQVFGKAAGKTKAIAALVGNPSVADSLWIVVRSNTPEWKMPADTTVGANLPVLLRPKLKEDFGTINFFAWDAMGDGVWDDSTTALKDLNLTWAIAGTYSLKLRVRDSEGHVVDIAIQITVVIGPDIRIQSPADSTWVNTPNVAVAWSVNGKNQTTQTTETLKQEGFNLITRSATDSAGNRFEVSVRVYLDTTAPAKPFFHGGLSGNTLKPTWKWRSGGGGNGQFRVSLDAPVSGTNPSQTDTVFTPAAPLTEGVHTLHVQERDAAGNWSAVSSLPLLVDVTPPSAPEIISKDGTNTRNVRPAFVFRGKGGGMGVFRAKADDSVFVPGDSGKSDTNFIPKADLTEGLHRIYAQERDSAGNWSSTSQIQITVNLSAPGAPKISGKTPTNNPKPTWTWIGTSTQGARIYRFGLDDSVLTAKAPVPDTSYTPTVNLAEGLHTLYVQERDSAGNWSASSQYPIRVDLTPPAKPVVTGTATPTTDLTPTWTWTGDAADGSGSFRFKLDDSLLASVTPSDVKTFTPSANLAAGAHTLYVQESDGAGNWSASGTYSVTIDLTGPAQPVVTGTASPTNDATPTWNWTGDVAGGSSTFRFKLDTATFSAGDPTTTVKTFTPAANLSAGTHVLYVQERDALGNWSPNGQFSITIDLTGPAQPVVTGTATPTNDATPTWNWTGDATGGSGTFRFKLDTAVFAANDPTTTAKTYTPTANLTAATHTLYVQERDAAGNWSASGQYTLRIDVTPPNAPVFNMTLKSPLSNLRPIWTWVSGGGSGMGRYRYKMNDSNLTTGATTISATQFQPTANLSEGLHTMYLQESDSAGNFSATSRQSLVVALSGLAGAQGFSPLEAENVVLAVSPTGVPYVAFSDGIANDSTALGRATVMRLNGSQWQVVGTRQFSPFAAFGFTLVFNASSVPYLSMSMYDNGRPISAVMRLNGSNWEMVGGEFDLNTSISIAFSATGELFAAHQVYRSINLACKRLNSAGTTWDNIGGSGFQAYPSGFKIAIHPNGIPYIAYVDFQNGNQLGVQRLNASSSGWETVGGLYANTGESAWPYLTFHPNGTPYVAFADIANANGTSVIRLNSGGTGWETVGTRGYALAQGVSQTTYQSVQMGPDGLPYIGFLDSYKLKLAAVARLNGAGTGWETIGSVGTSNEYSPTAMGMALSPAGIPYVVISDGLNTNKASVFKVTFAP